MTELEQARWLEAANRWVRQEMGTAGYPLELYEQLVVENWEPYKPSQDVIALRQIYIDTHSKTSFLPLKQKSITSILAGDIDQWLEEKYLPFYEAGKSGRSIDLG